MTTDDDCDDVNDVREDEDHKQWSCSGPIKDYSAP
jgi:hypothetical protein